MFGHATVCSGWERSGAIAEYTVWCKTDTIPSRYGGTWLTARFIIKIKLLCRSLPERTSGTAVGFFYRL